MLTLGGGWSVGLMAVGLLFLFSMFACLHGRRYCGILMALKRNLSIINDARTYKHTFEMTQVRMRESTSFQEWWEAVCSMSKKMHFQTIGLWNCHSGQYVRTCIWDVPEDKFQTGKSAKFTLPIRGNGATEWEIRAHTSVNGYLELSGRQAMLLARLMDEFPLPEHKEKAEQLELFNNSKHSSSIRKNA